MAKCGIGVLPNAAQAFTTKKKETKMSPMRTLPVFMVFLFGVVHGKSEYTGTTPGFVQIFHGRCFEYLERYASLGLLDEVPSRQARGAYCENIWKIFHDAFAFKDPCKLTQDSYKRFFLSTGMKNIVDKILFWSKHEDLSRRISNDGKRAVVLRDTLSGYLTTDLNWCGDPKADRKTSNGINFKACPVCKKNKDDKTTKEPFEIFWGAASHMFAARAVGTVHHLVNGALSDPFVAYSETTFFYLHELPNIRPETVTEFRLIVANEPQKTVKETCGTRTIKELQTEIKRVLGKDAVCLVNPAMVMHIMCTDKPNTPECVKGIPYQVGKQY